jgi:hypothetical protein
MMKTWIGVALVAVAAFSVTDGAQAQTKKELVAKVIALQLPGIEGVGRSVAGRTAQQVLAAAGQAMQRVPRDKRDAVGKEVQSDVKKFHDEIEPLLRKKAAEIAPALLSPTYEEKYSEDELKTVIAWLESPVSKKFSQGEGELAQSLVQKLVADTRSSVEPKMKALEATLSKRMGLDAAAPKDSKKK